jgi:Bacterial SH3 domain/SPOR domain
MIEVIGKDGRVFRFQDGTSEDVIQTALNNHYGEATGATSASIAPPPVATPPPVQPQPTVPPPPAASYGQAPSSQPIYEPPPYYPEPEAPPPPSNKAMQVTMMAGAAALGVLAVTGILWTTGMIGKKPAVTPPVTQSVNTPFNPTTQPDLRQVQVATQIRKEPKSDGSVLKEMVAGATLDVLGEQTFSGVSWLKVRLDQTTGGEGFVIASHVGAIGSSPPPLVVAGVGSAGTPVNGVQPPINGVNVGVPAPAPLPIPVPPPAAETAIPQSTVYAASEQLNVRSGPSPNSPIVERLDFGNAMTAFARGSGGWLKVRTETGRVGWVKGSYVSSNPSVAPLTPLPPPPRQQSTGSTFGGGYIARAPRGFYVQAGAARTEGEVQDLVSRAQNAASCTGSAPKVYQSDAFVKTKERGMALIAYGPFSDRRDAINFRDNLRPCIYDTFITEQPY